MVKVSYRKQEWQLDSGITLREAVRKVGLKPENMLGLRDGKLVPDDTILADGEVIILVTIVSGG